VKLYWGTVCLYLQFSISQQLWTKITELWPNPNSSSYHLRGVEGSCADHLTRILYGRYAANVYTYYYLYSVTPHSFIPDLKPSFSASPSHCSLPFLFHDWHSGFPGLLTNTSAHIYFSVILFSTFLVVDSICWLLLAFSALTLLVGRQEGHPACKNWVVGCWRGYLSGASTWPSWCHCHSLSLASVKSTFVLLF